MGIVFFLVIFITPICLFGVLFIAHKIFHIAPHWTLPATCAAGFLLSRLTNLLADWLTFPQGVFMYFVVISFLVLACITIILHAYTVYLSKKGSFFQWTLLALLLGISLGITYNRIFIEPHEIGEKGNAYIYSKYPAWRILD